jgi:hypothetical protein
MVSGRGFINVAWKRNIQLGGTRKGFLFELICCGIHDYQFVCFCSYKQQQVSALKLSNWL